MKTLRLLDPDHLPGDGVLRAEDVRALHDADAIVARAERDAAALLATQQTALQKERRDAYGEAYSEGLCVFLDAADLFKVALQQQSDQLKDVLGTCLHHVLGALPDETVLDAAIRGALPQIDVREDIVISAHPDRLPALAQVADAIATPERSVTIEGSPSLDRETCMIMTGSEVIDVSATIFVDQLLTVLEDLDLGAENAAALDALIQ